MVQAGLERIVIRIADGRLITDASEGRPPRAARSIDDLARSGRLDAALAERTAGGRAGCNQVRLA